MNTVYIMAWRLSAHVYCMARTPEEGLEIIAYDPNHLYFLFFLETANPSGNSQTQTAILSRTNQKTTQLVLKETDYKLQIRPAEIET